MKIVMFALLLSAHCELTTALRRQHFYISGPMTWKDAQRYCRKLYEDMSSVDSQEESTPLNSASGSTSGSSYPDSWVVLKISSTDTWEWSDESERSFLKWPSTDPNESGYDHCAVVKNCELLDGSLTNTNTFFCYKWDTELIVVKEKKSWEDALQYCRTHHTDLASLPTDLHLIQTKQTAETSSVWTGLRFLAGSWFWLSGEDLGDLSAQLPACPANYTYCGSLNMKTQSWENRNCMEKLNFVCY